MKLCPKHNYYVDSIDCYRCKYVKEGIYETGCDYPIKSDASSDGQITKVCEQSKAEMECDVCHNKFEIPIERANQIKEQKKANPKAKAVCSKCGGTHLSVLAMMQPKEEDYEPEY